MAFTPQRLAISNLYQANSLSRHQYGGRASRSLIHPQEQDCSSGVSSRTKSSWGNQYHTALSMALIGVSYEKNLLNQLITYSYNVKPRAISDRLSTPSFTCLGNERVIISVKPRKTGAIYFMEPNNYSFPFSSARISGWPETESSLMTELLGGCIFQPRLY